MKKKTIIFLFFVGFNSKALCSEAKTISNNKTIAIEKDPIEEKEKKSFLSNFIVNKKSDENKFESYEFNFGWDRNLSQNFAYKFLSNFYYSYEYLYDLTPDRLHTGWVGLPIRIINTYINYEISKLLNLINYTWFGYGYRLREFGIKQRYTLKPYSFSFLKGIVWYGNAVPLDLQSIKSVKNKLTKHEYLYKEITIHIAPAESADVAKKHITSNILKHKYLNTIDSWMYIVATMYKDIKISQSTKKDIILKKYIKSIEELTKQHSIELWKEKKLNYIHNYVNKIIILYDDKKAISVEEIKYKNKISWLDPFFYYSILQIIYYCISDYRKARYFMIPLWYIDYLPTYNLVLAPYGLENQIINYFKLLNISGKIFVNFGNIKTKIKYYWSLGVFINLIKVNKYIGIGGSAYLWNQPELYKNPNKTENKYGGLVKINTRYNILKQLALDTSIGFKTKGYVQGNMLDMGIILGIDLVYKPF